MVWLSRYWDLFTTFYSWYNSAIKIFYINSAIFICCAIRRLSPTNATYRIDQDVFSKWKHAVAPAAAIAFVVHLLFGSGLEEFDLMELSWTFSIVMEPLALIPQAIMYRRYRQIESLTGGTFLLMMGTYRLFYVLNWIWRAHNEPHYRHHYFVYACGCCEVLIAFGGLFCWIPGDEGQTSAPLGPQMKQFCHATYMIWIFLTIMVGVFHFLPEDGPVSQDSVTGIVAAVLVFLPCACADYFLYSKYCAKSDAATRDDEDPQPTAVLSAPLLPSSEAGHNEMPKDASDGPYEAPAENLQEDENHGDGLVVV